MAADAAFNGTPAAEAHERRMRRVLEAIYRDLGLAAEPPPRSSRRK